MIDRTRGVEDMGWGGGGGVHWLLDFGDTCVLCVNGES